MDTELEVTELVTVDEAEETKVLVDVVVIDSTLVTAEAVYVTVVVELEISHFGDGAGT